MEVPLQSAPPETDSFLVMIQGTNGSGPLILHGVVPEDGRKISPTRDRENENEATALTHPNVHLFLNGFLSLPLEAEGWWFVAIISPLQEFQS